jgi:hypothetical protein
MVKQCKGKMAKKRNMKNGGSDCDGMFAKNPIPMAINNQTAKKSNG